MIDPSETPAADGPSSVPQSSAEAQQVLEGFQRPHPLFAVGDSVPHSDLWALERPLGTGGFSEVWLARHTIRDELAAVKFCTHRSRHKLTKHEMRIIVQTMKHAGEHPNIVPLLECNLTGDTPWLMYEYVEGGTLAKAIERWQALQPRGRLPLTVRTLYPIASALAAFHRFETPIVHRDLKPQNVLMAGAVPRITDFGIAGFARPLDVTSSHPLPTMLRIAGTLRYCGPERLREPPPDPHPRDDVFALGVMAYQLMLADLSADPGSDAADDLRAIDTPAPLVELIVRSVSKKPERRPADAGDWAQALTAWLPAGVAPAAPPSPSLTGRRVTLAVPGKWSARPADSDEPWKPVADTPGAVPVAPNTEYAFRPRTDVTGPELAGLHPLRGLPSFRALDLSWCEQLTDVGLSHLTAFGQLHDLDLSGCVQVTDFGLSYLTALHELRRLDLSCCAQITDRGLGHLVGMNRLKYVTLLICERLTDAGVAAFRKAVPGCEVRD